MIRSLTPPAHVTKSEVVKQAHIPYTERLFFFLRSIAAVTFLPIYLVILLARGIYAYLLVSNPYGQGLDQFIAAAERLRRRTALPHQHTPSVRRRMTSYHDRLPV